ncbi:ATP-dependent helicase [Aquabacterium lacunae]|uniref:DNA 3'-5' helicase n=1 Tax=Aquabacterium lacunae TaxID=2528630 RepID=A0A4Q9GZ14_9BURK|nr:ATP-dependent helicase [Aquabacterium lacunae]TBO30075.1 ATP-dependent helicase [Aquabacterium lacunae]
MSDSTFQPQGLSPTDEQLAIQLERRRHVIIEANAGAAKTTTLALRLAQALHRGADPARILALTYTEPAVLALQQALARIGVPTAQRQGLRVQTFDRFCRDLLATFEEPGTTWLDTPEALRPHVLTALARTLDNPDERHREHFALEGNGEGSVEGLLLSFRQLKGTMDLFFQASESPVTPALAESLGHDYLALRVYGRYELLRRGGHPDRHAFRAPHDATYDLARMLLTDDDRLALPVHPLALGLNLVLVDEMHDTNRAMFTVLQHLLRHNPCAFVGVGDRDQVIHSVAGADARFMGEWFEQEVAVPHRPPLHGTWRFGASLATPVARLARKPCVALQPQDTLVEVLALDDTAMRWQLLDSVPGHPRARRPLASRPEELAVLLRHPSQSVALEASLLQHGVNYRTLGFTTFLWRPEVLFLRALMAHAFSALDHNPTPDTRQRLLGALLTFTGAQVDTGTDDLPGSPAHRQLTAQALKAVAHEPALLAMFMDNQVLRTADRRVRAWVHEVVALMQQGTVAPLVQALQGPLRPDWLARRVMVRQEDVQQVERHLQALLALATEFDDLPAFMRGLDSFELHHLTGRKAQQGVVLATLEATKGLEFEHVIMPGLNSGEFGGTGRHSDNRNLFYVGITRARRALTLVHRPDKPTRFLKDAGWLP